MQLIRSVPANFTAQSAKFRQPIQPRTSPSKFGGKFNSLVICLLNQNIPTRLKQAGQSAYLRMSTGGDLGHANRFLLGTGARIVHVFIRCQLYVNAGL